MARVDAKEKLRARCHAIADVLPSIRAAWQMQLQPTQKDLLETLVGAALWYLPKVEGLWTGLVSARTLEECRSGKYLKKRPSEEHLLPRKVAAWQLFEIADMPRDELAVELERRYRALYGRFNFVTPSENKALVRFQRRHVFDCSSNSYGQAQIVFHQASDHELRRARKSDAGVIEVILARAAVDAAAIDKLALPGWS